MFVGQCGGTGLTATHTGLQHAVGVFAPIIGALGLASLVAVTVTESRARAAAEQVRPAW